MSVEHVEAEDAQQNRLNNDDKDWSEDESER